MTAHLSDEQILAYRGRSLAGAELLDVSEHIGECEACRLRIASPDEMAVGARAVRMTIGAAEPLHLTYEELESYVDGTMDASARNSLAVHTRECRVCAADLAEMLALRSELQPPRVVVAPAPRASFWSAIFGWRGGLALAGAACALLLVVVFRPQSSGNVVQVSAPPQSAEGGSEIRDGGRVIRIASNGAIKGLDTLPASYRDTIEEALSGTGIAPSASLTDLAPASGVLLGSPNASKPGTLLEPLSTVVESRQPVFRWQPVESAMFRVGVYDGAFRQVADSGWISSSEWQATQPLDRGARYSWQLNIRKDGATYTVPVPPAPEARFRVLADDAETELMRARSQAGDSHLLLAILYARDGLLGDAARELRMLREQNPQSDKVAHLLAEVEELRRTAR